jgi:hypothetical protein
MVSGLLYSAIQSPARFVGFEIGRLAIIALTLTVSGWQSRARAKSVRCLPLALFFAQG